MKKNYFFSLVCLLLSLVAGTAMAESITDVYGKYTFTATMTVAEGQDASKLSDNCDVTISKDAGNIYKGYIDGIAGSTKGGHAISDYTGGQLVIKNMNDYNTGNFDAQIYFSVLSYSDKTKGYNPYGGVEMPDWKMTVDPTTGDITIPDFCIVSVTNYDDSLATIVATFTNAKLTLIEKEKTDVPDITGNYTYAHGEGTYDYNHDTTFSPDYTFTLTKADDTNKNYTATFNFDQNYAVTLPATFDGVTVAAPFDSIYFGEKKDSIRLGSINNKPKGEISFSYVKAGVLSAYSGFCIARDSISEELKDSTFQWFVNGKAKDPSQEKQEEIDFSGTYTVEGTYIDYRDNYAEKQDQFTIEVKTDDYGTFVPVFWGGDNSSFTYGGLSTAVNKDNPRELDIYCNILTSSATEGNYYFCADMNVDESSYIALTANADGTYSLAAFMIIDKAWGTTTTTDNYYRYYSELTITKNEEPKPEPTPAPSISGTYKYTGKYYTMDDQTGVDKEFDITIENIEGKYYMTDFDGDIYSATWGECEVSVTDTTSFPVTITVNKAQVICGGGYPDYNALFNYNDPEDATAMTITLNEDGTCEITSEVAVYIYHWYSTYDRGSLVGWYGNGKLERPESTAISDIKAATTTTNTSMYDMSGRKAAGKGLRVVDGKVMFVK